MNTQKPKTPVQGLPTAASGGENEMTNTPTELLRKLARAIGRDLARRDHEAWLQERGSITITETQ
jgi:hypothetical protein